MQERDVVKEYYGKTLQSSEDLKTTACCDIGAVPEWLKPLLANIHPEVLSRYYGCGLIAPALLEGCRILDLGCGSGRDVYALAQLVGPTGEVVGLDMTDEQLDVARRHQGWHAEKFGYNNVRFVQGYPELDEQLRITTRELTLTPSLTGVFDLHSHVFLSASTRVPIHFRVGSGALESFTRRDVGLFFWFGLGGRFG